MGEYADMANDELISDWLDEPDEDDPGACPGCGFNIDLCRCHEHPNEV